MVDFRDGEAKRVFISPLDRLNALVYLHWSLVLHAPNLDEAIQRLAKGLSKLGTAVPYLKGRVSYPTEVSEDEVSLTTRLVISWSPDDDPDLKLQEHHMANKLPSLATMKGSGAPAHFFPTDIVSLPLFVDVSSRSPQPVFEATYIPLEDGGLVLNMCVHHGVMDGRGLATLTEMWADFTRRSNGTEAKASLARFPDPEEPLARSARLVAAASANGAGGAVSLEDLVQRYQTDHAFGQNLMALLSMTAAGPKCASRIFTFSGAKLEHAKKVLTDQSEISWPVTINSILNAIIWSSITYIRLRWRHQKPATDLSRFSLAVDGRKRLDRAIDEPGPYLGNVVLISSVDMPLDILNAAGAHSSSNAIASLAPVVQVVADAAARITKDHISGLLSALQQVQDTSDVGPGWLSPHRVNFMASSWANLPLYECDFGPAFSGDSSDGSKAPGTPVFVRYPYADYNDGNIVVLPRRRTLPGEDEAIEVYVMLAEEDLVALEQYDSFRSWLKM